MTLTHIEKLKRLAEKWGSAQIFSSINRGKRKRTWQVMGFMGPVGRWSYKASTPEEAIEKAFKEEFPDEV